MADPIASQPQKESTTSTVITIDATDSQQAAPTVHLKLRKPKTPCDRKVQWSTGTVDNEMMNKKKSKSCCIYKKPKKFDESSSEESSDDECDHCDGSKNKKAPENIAPTTTTIEPSPAIQTNDNEPNNVAT